MALSPAELPSESPAFESPPCLDAVAQAATWIRQRLAAKAQGGSVAMSEIEAVLAELTAPGGAVAGVLRVQAGQCGRRSAFVPRRSGRKGAFHRLMVRPFETLLDGKPPPFPRSFLPHYFRAVDAAGNGWLPRTEEVCRTVLQSLVLEQGHKLEWDAFYADPRVRHILTHALRHLFGTLETPAGQWMWDQMMLHPDREGRAPAKDQADLVTRSLRDTWRALELELNSCGR